MAIGLAGVAATPAQADEQYFGYVYSAEVVGKRQTEAELWATDRRDKDEGRFDAQDYGFEVEPGFTDRFSVAGGRISPATTRPAEAAQPRSTSVHVNARFCQKLTCSTQSASC